MGMKLLNTEVTGTRLTKLKYLSALPKLKKLIDEFKPHIIHAHYATSYGLLGALTGFHPFIISLWGSDVFDFPGKSILYQNIFQFVLNRADSILSTSRVMAKEAAKYYKKEIAVTPFGVDINLFKPEKASSIFPENDFVIGVAKNLEYVYGIDILLSSFKLLKSKHENKSLKLLIAGTGTYEIELKQLAKNLGIEKETVFVGRIKNEELPRYYSMMDAAVFLSRKESFGVAALEAMACGKPVIAARIGGYQEIIDDNVTGFLIEPGNTEDAVNSIEILMSDKELALNMGRKGRDRVIKNYNLNDSLKNILLVYAKHLNSIK